MIPTIPGYRVQREIGKGGMGVVYQARREGDDQKVAIKVLPTHFANPTTARRFQREGRSLLSIRHPNIVEVYEVECHEGSHYIVMEFLEGMPLSQVLRQSPKGLSIELCRQLTLDITRALHVIHEKGLIHRDLKPGNIVVGPEGRAKLLDFGLVQVEGLTMLTETGSLLGTPLYMSPEQCAGLPADHRSDIYSLGIVLFQILTGQLPFQSESVYELLELHKNQVPPAPRAVRRDTPEDLEQVILRCLEKKPESRFSSVTKIFEALGASAEMSPEEAGAPPIAVPMVTRGTAQKTRSKSTGRVTALLFLGVIGAAILLVSTQYPKMASTFRRTVTSIQAWWNKPDPHAGTVQAEVLQPELERAVEAQFAKVRLAESLYDQGIRLRTDRDLAGAFIKLREAWQTYGNMRYLETLIEVGCELRRFEELDRIWSRALSENPSLDPYGRLGQMIRDRKKP